jgi:tRNA(Ile)-lysidine synthase TilS/MesJ
MTSAHQLQKRSKRNSTARREEERRFVAEQQFLRARSLNYAEIGRETGVTPNTVRNVALGINRNDRVMTVLLREWRRAQQDTKDLELSAPKEGDAA